VALEDVFLTPVGLLALASLIPLTILYLISRTPVRVALPTVEFLLGDPERRARRLRLDVLRRSLLFVIQALVLVLLALALAGPYTTVTDEGRAEVVVVVDASASMATETGSGTRFDRAIAAARAGLPETASVVVAGDVPRVAVRRGAGEAAAAALSSASVEATDGNLRAAIALAASIAADGEPIRVYSDFADDTDWRGAVEAARAGGHRVELVRLDGGGTDNVGIVALDFGRTTVTATVANTGTDPATRTVSFGGMSAPVSLRPGDLTTVTLAVPGGGGEVRLSPGDSFPVDDVAYVAAADRETVRVLFLTNDPDRYVSTALDVIDEVTVDVETLPAAVTDEYDVVVFGSVDPERLLAGNLALARETVRSGGGVVVLAQRDLGSIPYGDLLLVDPGEVVESGPVTTAVEDPLTAGIDFPAPEEHVDGELKTGRTLVRVDGAPLVAVAETGPGRVVYYGYLDGASEFPFDYRFPVFVRRLVYYAADRLPLEDQNRATGDRLTFDAPTTVTTPAGDVTVESLSLDRVGFYTVGDRRIGVSLLDGAESNLTSSSVVDGGTGTGTPANGDGDGDVAVVTPDREPSRERVPFVSDLVAAVVLLVVLEMAYLVRRGDL
jgi:hypothetical protein